MTIALVTLSIITSLGIYGLLSTGFQKNIAKLEIGEKQVKNVEVKKKRFEEIKVELTKEKTTLDGDITKLRDGLSNNTTTQTVDKRTGQIVTKANNANRKSFEGQLKEAQTRRDTISKRIDAFNDSITKLDVDILNMESKDIGGGELGTIKYLSELLGWDIKKTANFFILILIFVFDPLAITLVIATNQAFKVKRKDEDTIHDTIQVEPIIIEKIVEVPVEVIREVERIVEIPVYIEKNNLPIEEYFEKEDLIHLQEQSEKEINEEQEVQTEPKRLSYINRNGGSLRIDRI
jgi:hypothetical protein